MRRLKENSKALAILFGALFVALFAIVAVANGIGKDEPSGDAVAVVDGEEITREQFDTALTQAAARQNLDAPPPEDDPQYEQLRDEAMNDILDTAWIQAEAEERGIEVSEREVQQQFEQTKAENFQTEKEYQDFLKQSGFTQEDIDLRVELQVLSERIQEEITQDAGEVPEDEVREFYDANEEQFVQPETRDVRIVLNTDEQLAQDAADQLSEDNSPESWNKVAKALSTDEATKGKGGVREDVTEGVFPEPLNEEVFSAEQGEVIGPVETDQGFYVFQVDQVEGGGTTSFDESREQISQQLSSQREQEVFSSFVNDYRDRWTEVTICADDFPNNRCDNFVTESEPCPDPSLPEDQQQAQLEQSGCPPPVLSISPGAPGSFSPGVPNTGGGPQRPHPPGGDDAAPAGALPGGVQPGGAVPVQPGAGGAAGAGG